MWQNSKNIYHLFTAFFASVFYGFPVRKLTVIGVTGTSGKTTTVYMIYEVLKAAGYKVSLISSIKAIIGGKDFDTGFHVTTPDPKTLQQHMQQAVKNGDTHFVLEISSHALDQNRAGFVHFSIGVLTTLAHEHLDYHKTFLNYAKAKFKLLHLADTAVIPVNGIPDEIKNTGGFIDTLKNVKTFGISTGDENQKDWQLTLKMPGEFNLKNALAAAAVARMLGIDKKIVKNTLEKIVSLPGRFEEIKTGKDFRVIIDFAHKPDALESILEAVRSQRKKNGKIIIMYGAASERDVLKRPMMGKISGEMADITVLTDEDPRFEDPMKILNEIAAGCEEADAQEFQISNFKYPISNKHIYFKIPNRREAINFIISKLAKKDDIIVFCGKGHEKSMSYHGVEKPWSEHEAVQEALKLATSHQQLVISLKKDN